MKIAVIGGAGVRTPLLVNGLTRSDLPIEEIALFDTDAGRLATIGGLAAAFSPAVRSYADARSCVAGADFVLLSIRVGGIAARVRDEAVAVAHDTAGQETVGAGGFLPFATAGIRWGLAFSWARTATPAAANCAALPI